MNSELWYNLNHILLFLNQQWWCFYIDERCLHLQGLMIIPHQVMGACIDLAFVSASVLSSGESLHKLKKVKICLLIVFWQLIGWNKVLIPTPGCLSILFTEFYDTSLMYHTSCWSWLYSEWVLPILKNSISKTICSIVKLPAVFCHKWWHILQLCLVKTVMYSFLHSQIECLNKNMTPLVVNFWLSFTDS